MNVIITGRKVHLWDSFKTMVEEKLARFDRIFGDDAVANVTVTVEKNDQIVEITIRFNGHVYRAEKRTRDMNESLDDAINAIAGQIRKNKTRLEKRFRADMLEAHIPETFVEEEKKFDVVKVKKFAVKPSNVEEAIMEMNLVGHQFYMFRDSETNEINVVYKRRDGKYGLLIPEDK